MLYVVALVKWLSMVENNSMSRFENIEYDAQSRVEKVKTKVTLSS